jgi:hypothetical protein
VGIDLLWRANDGTLRDAAYDESSTFSDIVSTVREDLSKRHLLVSAIDPYGDTRFVTGQAPQLLREFELIRRDTPDADRRISIGRVISILRAAEGTSDEWLEFSGD